MSIGINCIRANSDEKTWNGSVVTGTGAQLHSMLLSTRFTIILLGQAYLANGCNIDISKNFLASVSTAYLF
jgi:hypothetical protein